MRSRYSTSDLQKEIETIVAKIEEMGYTVRLTGYCVSGRYGYSLDFDNGKTYITGHDSKDICMRKLLFLDAHIEDVVKVYGGEA